MKKNIYLFVLVLVCVGGIALYVTEGNEKPYVVGVLQYRTTNLETLAGFKAAFAEAGFVAGENVVWFFDGPARTRDELSTKMDAILVQKPDLIFSCTTPASSVAKAKTQGKDIPVVFGPVNDPVSTGIVENIRQPEGNITGVRLGAREGRRLQSLLQLKPDIKNVFVPYNPKDKSALASLEQLQRASKNLRVKIVTKPLTYDVELTPTSEYVPEGMDAIFMPREGLVMSHFKEFNVLGERFRIPVSTPRMDQVEQGVVTGYGFMGYELGKQAARMALCILRGTPVSRVPVETARDYQAVNLPAARRIGLDVSDSFLRRTHYIYRK